MITFTFDGTDFSSLIRVNEITGRGIAPSTVNTVKIPGRHGVFAMSKDFSERVIEVTFMVVASSLNELREDINDLSALFSKETAGELTFSDEPDKHYFAIPISDNDMEEIITYGMGRIQFFCADPLKYSKVIREFPIVGGRVDVVNAGSASAEPVFEITALQNTTYVDVFTDEAYMRVGQPDVVEKEPLESRVSVLADPMNSLTSWVASSTIEQGVVTGSMGTNGFSFSPQTWGVNDDWHGPAVQRSIPGAPYKDFEVEIEFDMLNPKPDATGRVVFELLDTGGNIMARMNMNKRATGSHGNEAVLRIGNATNGKNIILTSGSDNRAFLDFRGVMRIARINKRWELYVAKVDPKTGVHSSRVYETYTDNAGTYATPQLAQVRVHIGQYGKRTPVTNMAINTVRVFRVNTNFDQKTPVLLKAGDTLVLDHRSIRNLQNQSPIRINGEPAYGYKDFGATFFDVDSGTKPILIEPAGKVTGRVWFRERYL